MIYLIDDKISRQRDYGWDEDRLSTYSNIVKPIWEAETLNDFQEQIIQGKNVILFHESFPQSKDFNETLDDNSTTLYVAKFSGSKGARFVDERRCMLPPDVLYGNLEIFIKKYQEGELDFRYLAFGENYEIEEQLRNRLNDVNAQNTTGERVSCERRVFFAATSDDIEVEPPFDITPTKDWDLDFIDRDITDIDLDGLVNQWFLREKYDVIYIPLCFGNTLSDFIGLRLAMHIRLTPSLNQETPIYVYGVSAIEELTENDCFDILKTKSVRLINCDNTSFISSVNSEMPICNLPKEMKLIRLDLPSNIGRHTLANQWGAEVLSVAANLQYEVPLTVKDAMKSLFFKHTLFKTNRTRPEPHSSEPPTPETIKSEGRKILLIDDDAESGWEQIVCALFANAQIDVIKNKIRNFDVIPKQYIRKIQEDFYDLYLLDLRLQGELEESIVNTDQFSGMDVLEAIKQINPGNQVIMMTASNKAWNMKKIMKKHANGYYIKEAPELLLPFEFSQENFKSFRDDILAAFHNDYKRDLWARLDDLREYISHSSIEDDLKDVLCRQLEIYEHLLLNATNQDDLSLVFTTLFQVFDALKQYFSKEMLFTSMSIPDNIRDIVNEKGTRIMSEQDFKNIIEVNKARNNFIHKLNKKCRIDYKSVDGIRELFKVVSSTIHSL